MCGLNAAVVLTSSLSDLLGEGLEAGLLVDWSVDCGSGGGGAGGVEGGGLRWLGWLGGEDWGGGWGRHFE